MSELQVRSVDADIQSAIEQFRIALSEAQGALAKAAKIYVDIIDKFPEAKEEFKIKNPSVSAKAWINLEKVARGQMLPEFVRPDSVGATRAQSLPVSDQKRLLSGPVEVLCVGGDILKVQLSDLSIEHSSILFAKDHIRTLSEQKVFIERQKSASIKQANKVANDKGADIKNEIIRLLTSNNLVPIKTLLDIRKLLKG